MRIIKKITITMTASLIAFSGTVNAIGFNTNALDANDKENIDLSHFTTAGYIMPGEYRMAISANNHTIPEQMVSFYARDDKPDSSEACVAGAVIEQFGLKPEILKKITFWHDGQCADLSALEGVTTEADLATSTLYISIPQAWMEYSDSNWVPPSRWDEGIPGFIVDYNLNSLFSKPKESGSTSNISMNGTSGLNAGPWRLRGDYQGNYTHNSGENSQSDSSFDWSRVYMYRAIKSLAATLSVGENYFASSIFDTFRYAGASLSSDERMLPPNLRGYAPEVSGIARTNAKVTVTQQGRVLYQTTVASGPFRIQDLSSAVTGRLDVRVEEQDGSIQTFQVDTAAVPYLTRPGAIRYKTAVGQPSTMNHGTEGPVFASGEFSWGVNNNWSLFGGAIGSNDYNALSLGLGRDLYAFGAISTDIIQTYATNLPDQSTQSGKSLRVRYAKRFDEINSDISFAGYRFFEREFMSMNQYLNAFYQDDDLGRNKEMYTVTASKNFPDIQTNINFSYSYQNYWDQPTSNSYSATISYSFDAFSLKDVSVNLSASRSKNNGVNDDVVYVGISIPLNNQQSMSYSGQHGAQGNNQTVNYYNNSAMDSSYRLSAGVNNSNDTGARSQFSGFYNYRSSQAETSINASYVQDNFTSTGVSVRGGATITAKGAALHGPGVSGGTRLMVNTDDIAGVDLEDRNIRSNRFGIAVLNDVSSYYRTDTRIDINKLADDVEVKQSAVESALTEGAIGYRRFSMIRGEKVLATISLTDSSHPPFGSMVMSAKDQELGIVSDDGFTYLSGVTPGETLDVIWNGIKQCQVAIPATLQSQAQILLPCLSIK
ncbi:fimbria/pilus outer membrane usher protein [Yersinia pekkanenii]|uniref:Outer membrane usher protein n=1 Tax=Yersinia pekkanenii TaxID=1288385 RepID=A0A0T9RJC0_9GAMM|nr:fimbria/pilus outer membrane usher protein [Yersinia pekkanenii]CNI65812.1 outer membrane usher protein [Yersinia pekkanenii]CRY69602.1 outer membrane usher protein [Yersinia pekkanenii]